MFDWQTGLGFEVEDNNKSWRPPPYSVELARIIDPLWDEEINPGDEEFPQSCSGLWISGSGGHRYHTEINCNHTVVWWHPDDCYAYCDLHCCEADKKLYQKSWFLSRRIAILHTLNLFE